MCLDYERGDLSRPSVDSPGGGQSLHCTACEAALQSPGRDTVSFLLLDRLTIPLVGCAEHLEAFRSLCSLATDGSAELLEYRPAGGVRCPGCRHAPREPEQAIVPVGSGGLAILACESHQSDILDRFRTGLEVRRHLTSSLDESLTRSAIK
ncbi:hypothetical protein [Halovenus salina]|uniref:Uncharacterized protein n=1 Tax=Halovenus salina TaxID=1510225 RepID=A0ABD5W244_9EURY